MAAEIAGPSAFLWVDRLPEPVRRREVADLGAEARRGDPLHLETRDGRVAIAVPGGLVHHWIGTVYLPGVGLDRVLAFVRNYAGYPAVFEPMVESAQVLTATDDHFDVAMRTSTHKVITVVVEADYAVDYRATGAGRVWAKSVASHIQEIDGAGTPTERARPATEDHGYLWRLNTCAFEERGRDL